MNNLWESTVNFTLSNVRTNKKKEKKKEEGEELNIDLPRTIDGEKWYDLLNADDLLYGEKERERTFCMSD